MSQQIERRDIGGVLADLRVGVAEIKTTQSLQTKTLDRMEERLNVAILRDEFNAYKTQAQGEREAQTRLIADLKTAHDQQTGSSRTWRIVYGTAISALGVVIALIQIKVI